jgi:hypothetical protein
MKAAAYVGSPSAYTYTSVPEFEIEVSPNKTIIARGTIEQIREQALAHNPNWDEEYYAPAQKLAEERYQLVPAGADANSTGSTPSLEKRRAEDFDSLRITCGRPWHAVSYEGALKEALRLYGVKGTPQNGPGPGNCGRVGCSYGTAIIWCNDVSTLSVLPEWSEVGANESLRTRRRRRSAALMRLRMGRLLSCRSAPMTSMVRVPR